MPITHEQLENVEESVSYEPGQSIATDEWAEQSELDGGASVWEAFKAGYKTTAMQSVEYAGAEALWSKFNSELVREDSSNPMISIKEAKEQLDLDINQPIPINQAMFLSEAKKDKIAATKEGFSHLSFETPINALAAIAGGLLGTRTPAALATEAAVGAVAGPVGSAVGVAVGTATQTFLRFRTASRLYKAARAAGIAVKTSKLAPTVVPALTNTAVGLLKATKVAHRAAKPVTKVVKGIAVKEGVGNALEELAVHQIEATKGHKYAAAPTLAFGFFAPSILKGAAKVIGGAGAGAAKLGNAALDTSVVKTIKTKLPDNFSTKVEFNDSVNGLKNIDELVESVKTRFVNSDFNVKAELDGMSAIQEARKAIGGKQVDTHLTELTAALIEGGYKVNLRELFPFLSSRKAFRARLKEVRQELGLTNRAPKSTLQQQIDKVFETPQGRLDEYLKKNNINKEPPIKRDLEVTAEVKTPEAALKQDLDAFKQSDNVVLKSLAKATDDVDTAVDDFLNCIRG